MPRLSAESQDTPRHTLAAKSICVFSTDLGGPGQALRVARAMHTLTSPQPPAASLRHSITGEMPRSTST